jgi:hypothetical protein
MGSRACSSRTAVRTRFSPSTSAAVDSRRNWSTTDIASASTRSTAVTRLHPRCARRRLLGSRPELDSECPRHDPRPPPRPLTRRPSRVGSVRRCSRDGLPAARPLGQCCRYSRQHCTGLALWAARSRSLGSVCRSHRRSSMRATRQRACAMHPCWCARHVARGTGVAPRVVGRAHWARAGPTRRDVVQVNAHGGPMQARPAVERRRRCARPRCRGSWKGAATTVSRVSE